MQSYYYYTISTCQCDHSFTLDHILSCPKGGFPIICHNQVRNITSSLLSEVCSNNTIEPHLKYSHSWGTIKYEMCQPADPNAHLDLDANGVWGGWFEKTSFDVRVFNPFSKSNTEPSLSETYHRHENEKKKKMQATSY